MARMPLNVVSIGRSTIIPTPMPIPIPGGASMKALPRHILEVRNPDLVVVRSLNIPSIFRDANGNVRMRSVILQPGERALVQLDASHFVQPDGTIHLDPSGEMLAQVLHFARVDIGVF